MNSTQFSFLPKNTHKQRHKGEKFIVTASKLNSFFLFFYFAVRLFQEMLEKKLKEEWQFRVGFHNKINFFFALFDK